MLNLNFKLLVVDLDLIFLFEYHNILEGIFSFHFFPSLQDP